MIKKSMMMSNPNLQAYIPMDEVIQYRKDQKASGGRMVYKGIKLNNRTMHNFRPTIGRKGLANLAGRNSRNSLG